MDEKKMTGVEKQEYWRVQLKRWKESGKPLFSYCREQNISRASMRYWGKRLDPKNSRVGRRKTLTPAFVPVEVIDVRKTSGLPDPRWVAELIVHLAEVHR